MPLPGLFEYDLGLRLRVQERVRLRIRDIDRIRTVIHVWQGKRNQDRCFDND